MRVFNPQLISSGDSVLLLRHGTDLTVLRSNLNPPLDPSKIHEFEELVAEASELCAGKWVRLLHSSRVRAQESARIIVEKFGLDRIAEIESSDLIREVYHGDFKIINHRQGEIYPPLVDAWTLWAEALADMDIDYRYGNPVRKGEIKYPRLVGIFTKFGENHREFTIRVYSFMVDLIQRFYSDSDVFNIVLAHQATLSRIQRVFNALSSLQEVPAAGVLVREIEQASNRIDIRESHGVVVRYPPKDFSIRVLNQEVDHLKI